MRTNGKNTNVERIFPLTPLQEGMLFHYIETKSNSLYFEQSSIKINGDFDLQICKESLEILAIKHDALRTAIVHKSVSVPRQLILADRRIELQTYDYSSLNDEEYYKEVEKIKASDIERGFDLEKDSLMRVAIIKSKNEVYRMMWSFHHIIMDGWCLSILFGDFIEIYERLKKSIASKEELIHQYRFINKGKYEEYVRWLGKQNKETGLAYWGKLLNGYESNTYIQTDINIDIAQVEDKSNVEKIEISEELTQKLEELSKANHVTINTMFEAAWGILLRQYTCNDDVVFGKVVSGRNVPIRNIEQVIGLFINTIPVRVQSNEDSFKELIQSIQQQAKESAQYDFCSLAEIQTLKGNASLVHSIIAFENYYADTNTLEKGKEIFGFEVEEAYEETNYPLNLVVSKEKNILIKLLYKNNIYSKEFVRGILKHMEALIELIAKNPDVNVKDMQIITNEEQNIILNHFSQMVTDYPREKNIVELFEEQAERIPENIAVIYKSEKLTYSELNNKANQLAKRLMEEGIKPEDKIVIMGEKKIETIIAILAALKSGAAYVPIDSNYPDERKQFILQDCNVTCILATEQLKSDNFNKFKVFNLFENHWDKEVTFANLNLHLNPNNLAYILYTSGSTGMPKGVLVEHRSVVRLVKNTNFIDYTGIKILQTGAIGFDASTFEIWGALLNGGVLSLFPIDELLDIKKLEEEIKTHSINTMWLTAKLFNEIVAMDLHVFDNLNYLLIGGEKLSEKHVNQLLRFNNRIKLINGYGPTENTTFSLTYEIKEQMKQIPIGKPIANSTAYIVNSNRLCGIGMIGELCLGGDGLSRGYLNQKELTDEKFFKAPWNLNEVLYHSGDLARWRYDGTVEYLGRLDQQVKIRGFRIEPGEIENVILRLSQIKNCIVMPITGEEENLYLCAYYSVHDNVDDDFEKELKAYIRENLPSYMMPSVFMKLDTIPLNPNGKIDKNALPAPHETDRGKEEYVAPQNEIEIIVANVFSNILGLGRVGRNDNFFELGGHSLRATRVVNQIEKETGVRLPLKAIFAAPTVLELSEEIMKEKIKAYSEIPALEGKEFYNMSSAQKRLYIMNELDDTKRSYNMPAGLKVTGKIDLDKLNDAFKQLIQRHEVLRTGFVMKDGQPVQRIATYVDAFIEYESISNSIEVDVKKMLSEFVRPFDLSSPPLIRIKIVELSEEESILLFDMHHIISDGMSMNIIISDLLKLYNGESLEELRVQYKDYSEWMEKRDISSQKQYWIDEFKGEILDLNLPTDFKRGQIQSFIGRHVTASIEPKLKEKILRICEQTKSTEYMFLLSSFMILLSKYARKQEVVVGTPISGRIHSDTEKMIGMFVNTLAMKGEPKKDKTFMSFLSEMKQKSLKAYENQEFPFEELVENLDITRDISRNPLFDVVFALQNNDNVDIETSVLRFSNLSLDNKTAKFDLTMNIYPEGNGYYIQFEYCSDLFREATIIQMLQHYINILNAIADNPNQKIIEVSALDDIELNKVLNVFNDTSVNYPSDKTVIELFEEQVRKTPDNIAIVFEKEKITYKELNCMSNRIAHCLMKMGVQREDFVAILSDKNIEMIAAVIGVLKAGGAYVPIHVDYPEERINFILQDCAAKVLIKGMGEDSYNTEIPVINLKDSKLYSGNEQNPEIINQPEDLVYVIYTSGTTGNPKGALIEHKNVIRLVKNTNFITLNEDTIFLQTGAISFDASTLEIWGSLLNGGKLCLINNEVLIEPNALKESIRFFKGNTMFLTTALFNQLISADVTVFDGLKYLMTGGEAISQKHVRIFKDHNKVTKLFNVYGPTENTTFTTSYEIPNDYDCLPIGAPIANTRVYVMDDDYLCGIGMPGELCTAGDGVGRGYLNRDELTSSKFIAGLLGEERIYRTGDLVRWQQDGTIEYLGRIDNQVKIHGFRIELEEIKNEIQKAHNIKDTVVTVEEENDEKYLCAYIVADETIDLGVLKKEINKKLPDYMVPKHMMQIDAIPVTIQGKVDVRKLPKIQIASDVVYTAPRNETEKMVADIFAEILEIEKVGIYDNFFDMGGHSLKATRLINDINSRAGVHIPLKEVFLHPTVEAISSILQNNEEVEEYEQIPLIDKKSYYAASSAQRRLFFVNEMDKLSLAYNMPFMLVLHGKVSKDKVEGVIRQLTKRHESLRTGFKVINGEPVQFIKEEVQPIIEYVCADENILDEKKLMKEFVRPFDLSKAPLIHMKIVEVSDDKSIALFDMHHIISDGFSMNIFVREFSSLYQGGTLPEIKVQYKDYSEWSRKRDMSSYKEYWVNEFKDDIPVLDLPYDYPRPKSFSYNGRNIWGKVDKETTELIEKLCKKMAVTEYMVLLSSFMVLLSRYSRQEDIVVGTPMSGRTNKDTEAIVGMFVNTLAMRGTPLSDMSFVEFLNQMKEKCLKAFEYQEYPFEELISEVNLNRDPSRNPIFDVVFAFQNNENVEINANNLKVEEYSESIDISKFDISLNMAKKDKEYIVNFEYSTDLFKEESIQFMMRHFKNILREIALNSEQKIKDISMLDSSELETILQEFNNTTTEYPKDKTVVEIFEEQVRKYPSNIAVVFEEKSVTYNELNLMANKMAHKLKKYGVNRDEFVAVYSEKSIEMVAAILGILKAGGAYVPIHIDYPTERVKFILEDCSPKVLLAGMNSRNIYANIPVVSLNDASLKDEDEENLELVNKPEDLIYVIYTSGTTGNPKGAMIEHKNVVRLVKNTNFIKLDENTVVLQTGSISFDASTLEIWGSLLNGGKLCLINNEVLMNPAGFKELITLYQGNTMFLTTALFNQLIVTDVSMFDGLTYLLTGGEAISERHVNLFISHNKKTKLINGYGPTENTTFTTTDEIRDTNERLTIGKPIANTRVYVVEKGKLCGIGVPGELCTSGDGVGRGYLNREELTRSKFLTGFLGEDKIYHTGDLVRWLPNGKIEYLGRIDSQVKIRGFRIELGEIESIIRKQEGIKDVVVYIQTNSNGDKFICACIVSGKAIDKNELKASIGRELPVYMMPAYITQMDSIPVNKSGKVNRTALPKVKLISDVEYTAPSNEIEQVMVNAFEEVLGIERVGVTDSFFELGGDSIKAIRIVSKVREAGYELMVKTIMEEVIIQKIATQIKYVEKDKYVDYQEEIQGEIRLSPIQMKFFEKTEDVNHFNQAIMLDMEDYLDAQILTLVLDKITMHHDALRCVLREGKIYNQKYEKGTHYNLQAFDFTNNTEEHVFELIKEQCNIIQHSFNLEDGPLLRAAVFNTSHQDHLFLCIHHMVIDGVSWRILVDDLQRGYRQAKEQKQIIMPSKTISYKKWVDSLYDYANSHHLEKEKLYWHEVSNNINCREKLISNEGKLEYGGSGYISISLPQEISNKILMNSCKAYNTEVEDLFIGAIGLAVKRWRNRSSIVIDLEGHGRETLDQDIRIDRTVGWFTNVYPVCIETKYSDIARNIIHVKETLHRIPNKGMGYGILRYLCGDKAFEYNDSDIAFNYLGSVDNEKMSGISGLSEYDLGQANGDKNKLWTPIIINGSQSDDTLHFTFIWDKGKFTKEDIEKLAEYYTQSLEEIGTHCTCTNKVINTASDFGEYEWTEEEFSSVSETYSKEVIEQIYPLTSMQEGMMYHSLHGEGETAYFVQTVIRVNSKLNLCCCEDCLDVMAEKYSVLRTAVVHSTVGTPRMVTLKNRKVEFVVKDISIQSEQDKEISKIKLRDQDIKRGFDFEQDSLMRITILKLSEESYEMIWSFHHITMDGWCISLLFSDFLELYSSLLLKKASKEQLMEQAKNLKIENYGEFIKWLNKQDKGKALKYWNNLLDGIDSNSKISYEMINTPAISEENKDRVGVYNKSINLELTKGLEDLSAKLSVTVSTLLETAWSMVLRYHTSQNDVVYGKVVSGRNAPVDEIENMIGLFINTIPVRVQIQNESLEQIAHKIQEQANESTQYDYCSLAEIQKQVQNGDSLIQSLFIFENFGADSSQFDNSSELDVELYNSREETNYPITLTVGKAGSYKIELLYDKESYDNEFISNLCDEFVHGIQVLTNEPDKIAKEVEFISKSEKELILNSFNDTDFGYPKDADTFMDVFKFIVDKQPDKTAIICNDDSMSYKQLDDLSEKLALKLIELGVKPESRVVITGSKSVYTVVGIVGILKAGGAYVPVDPKFPDMRKKFIIEDSNSNIVLTTEKTADIIFDNLTTIYLGSCESYDLKAPVQKHDISRDNAAYVIYTSGSSGQPKGVVVEHRNVLNLVPMTLSGYGVNSDDVILQFASISFDQTVWDILGTLLVGATICLVEREMIGDADVFEDYVNDRNVTVAALTPTLLADLTPEKFKTLRIVESGGEAANLGVLKRWAEHVEVFNAYGPTEATVNATLWKYDKTSSKVLIGKPLPNTKIYIMNDMSLCGVGIVGEICIGGECVARGYLNRPELLAEKYIENPYRKGERIYRTGDLGRWMPDGSIQCLGRNDDQIKIRGYRIELGEIEKKIKAQKDIIDAAAVVFDNSDGDKYICGYFISENTSSDFESQLRNALTEVLPDYMIPRVMVRMEEFPKTINGKMNKKLLPEPDADVITGHAYNAPETKLQERLAYIWREVLNVESIGIDDDFFELGGHSLSVIRLVNKIYSEFGIKLKIQDIFQNITIRNQERIIALKGGGNSTKQLIVSVPKAEYYPASSAQKRLYLMYKTEGESVTYNMTGIIDANGELDLKKCEIAYRGLLKRYEILRTSLEMRDGKVVQVVHDDVIDTFKVLDLRNALDKQSRIEEMELEFFKPFCLETAPLIRMTVVCLEQDNFEIYINMHHSVSDGASMDIMLRNFVELYNSTNLKALEVQYRDYSVWQQSDEMKDVLKKQKEYWTNIYKDEITLLNLPTDYNRPGIQDFSGDTCTVSMDKKLIERLKVFSEESKTTIFMIMFSAFVGLMAKYSRQEDIVVGIPVVGRNSELLEDQIGMFVNTLAIRSKVRKEQQFIDFLQNIRKSTLEAYENQDYTFDELVEEVVKSRDMSRNPIFDIMFTFENYVENDFSINGVKFMNKPVKIDISKFDLTLHVIEKEKGIDLVWEYATSLFKSETIQTMAEYYIEFLKKCIMQYDEEIGKIDCISDKDKRKVLYDFNNSKKLIENRTIIELFEEQVRKTPKNIAVYCGDTKVTYLDLKQRIDNLARYLIDLGVKENSYVGILCEHSVELIVAIYAVMRAGAAYVPINMKYPRDRIEYIISDCKAEYLLVGSCGWDNKSTELKVIDLQQMEMITHEVKHLGTGYPDTTKPAYAMYTSGTTGKPKGVVISHSALANYITWGNKKYFNEDIITSMPLFSSIGFDLTVTTLFMPLTTGNSITIYQCEYEADAVKMIAYDNSIEVAKMTPAHLAILNNEKSGCCSIKTFIIGGEELLKSQADLTLQRHGEDAVIHNEYGPTEATVGCMNYEYRSGDISEKDGVLIGRPIDNVRLYVLNDSSLCGIGMPGELCIAGDGLAVEYLNQANLTEEKFIENPLMKGERIYRTGDLVRWLPDGNMEYFGRIDEQVKIRGFRIELGEIESAMLQSNMVKQAVVVVKKDSKSNPFLCAYYTNYTGIAETHIDTLKQKLKQTLPAYMIPQIFIVLEDIPLTMNGKVDKNKLPEPQWGTLDSNIYVEPENEIQKKLVSIWEQLLSVKKIGIEDDFFSLGGNSLKATHMILKIEEVFGLDLLVKDIFSNTTIRLLSLIIENSSMKNEITKNIPHIEDKDYYNASTAQKRMYMIYQLSGETITYNMPFIFKLKGDLNEARLRMAWNLLIQRHEVLRTSIELLDGEIIQKVHSLDNVENFYTYTDLSESNAFERSDLIKNYREDFFIPFALEKAPLINIQLIKLADDEYEMDVNMHHVVSDGASMNIMIRDLTALYSGEEQLESLRIQYRDYSEWQQSEGVQRALESQKVYWVNKFKDDIPQLTLPTDYIRPVELDFKGAEFHASISSSITEKIKRTAERTKTTTFMIMMSAFMGMLSKYSMQEDIIVGTPIEGRRNKDIQNQLGMYINTLAIRGNTNSKKHFIEFLNDIKNEMFNAYENQEYPFEELVEEVVKQRTMASNPIFDIMFVLQNNETLNVNEGGIVFSSENLESNVSKYDITLNAKELGDTISITWEYATSLFRKESIQLMSHHFVTYLENAVDNIEYKLGEIEMFDEAEKQKVLYEFNDTDYPYEADKSIVDLFEQQAKEHADEIAVVFDTEEITYEELNNKANAVAAHLKKLGLKTEDFVGITGRRRIETIVGILGILKAGGAYVPIDMVLPKDRKQYMISSCNIEYILMSEAIENIQDLEHCYAINLQDEKFNYASDNLELRIKPNNLAYVIFTSGSTGKPKGVLVEHKGVVNLKTMFKKTYESSNDRILQFASISFDASVFEIFGALLNGKRLYIVDELRNDVIELEDYIDQNQITMAILSPTYINEMNTDKLSCIKSLVSAGSDISVSLMKKLSGGKMNCFNAYGPTEATVHTCDWRYDPMNELVSAKIPIGKPIINTQSYILKGNTLCGIGEAGELCIGGVGLARGYLNNEELTKAKFVEHPYIKGKQIYRTGDIARWLPTGEIEYIGRSDNQVKIRGFRIEIEEVENIIYNINIFKECSVVAIDDAAQGKYLCAYYTLENSELREEVEALAIERMRKVLPNYMIPSLFIYLDQMPLTISGKIDKNRLPRMNLTDKIGVKYEKPRDEIEDMLAGLWSDILAIHSVGIKHDFFQLGGDSIKAIRLISKVRDQGYLFTMRDLMSNPTIESLRKVIKEIAFEETAEKEIAATVETETEEQMKSHIINMIDKYDDNAYNGKINVLYEMSAMQKMFYYSENTSIKIMIPIDTKYGAKEVTAAVKRMIRDYSVLRSAVSSDKKETIIEYKYTDDWNIPMLTRGIESFISEDSFTNISNNLLHEHEAFVNNRMLAKILLYCTGEGKITLYLYVHHMIWDAMSTDVFRGQLERYLSETLYELPVINDYKTYLNEITSHSVNKSAFSLVKYRDMRKVIKDISLFAKAVRNNRDMVNVAFSIGVSKKMIGFYEQNPINTLLYLLSETVFRDIDVKSIPILLIYHGRQGTDVDYADTLGLFLDLVPMSFKRKDKLSKMDVQKNIDSILKIRNKEKIHFMTMVSSWSDNSNSKETSKDIDNINIDLIPCINFLGMYNINKNSKEEYFEIRKKQENFMFAVDYSDEMLHFSISCFENARDTIVDDFRDVLSRIERDMNNM